MKWACDKAAAPLLKWNFKKAAAPLLKLIFPWKSSHTYINKMLKKVATPILKGFKKSGHSFAKANFQKAATTSFTFHKGHTAKQFLLS